MIKSTHYTLDFISGEAALLEQGAAFRTFIETEITQTGLTQLGVTAHTFDTGGYTLAVCLAESHLCIHTWPERNMAAFDIFVSNHNEENRQKVETLVQKVKDYFSLTVIREQYIERF